eukprot:TRINITY_DN6390_c0_g1_i1.p1 TRINITY_DN6390_c0_g1~~TRINITY_DN6390_c0_g1_i1.p1  ORF type:complete len:399 (+),score=68.05 TRINITY_DN6390_c0_g1_i1:273-1469(+)
MLPRSLPATAGWGHVPQAPTMKKRLAVDAIVSFMTREAPRRAAKPDLHVQAGAGTGRLSDPEVAEMLTRQHSDRATEIVADILKRIRVAEADGGEIGACTLGYAADKCVQHHRTTEYLAVLQMMRERRVAPPQKSIADFLYRVAHITSVYRKILATYIDFDLPLSDNAVVLSMARASALYGDVPDGVPLGEARNQLAVQVLGSTFPTRLVLRDMLANETPAALRRRTEHLVNSVWTRHRVNHCEVMWEVMTSPSIEEAERAVAGVVAYDDDRSALLHALSIVCMHHGNPDKALDVALDASGGQTYRVANAFYICAEACRTKGDRFHRTAVDLLAGMTMSSVPLTTGAAHSLLRIFIKVGDASNEGILTDSLAASFVQKTPATDRLLKELAQTVGGATA